MKNFVLIMKHYFKISFRVWMTPVLLILLPLGIVTVNILANFGTDALAEEATVLAAIFMVAFKFFGAEITIYCIFDDLKGPTRWRLLAAPVPQRTFLAAIAAAGFLVTVVQGAAIFGVCALIFGARWGNPWIFIAVFLTISIMVQVIALLISQVVKTRGAASGIVYVLSFGMMILGGIMFIPLGDGPFASFVTQYGTPFVLGWRAIIYSTHIWDDMTQAVINLGLLWAIMAVLIAANLVLAKAKRGRTA